MLRKKDMYVGDECILPKFIWRLPKSRYSPHQGIREKARRLSKLQ